MTVLRMFMTRYDLVFGLGFACSCSESLRAAGLQLLSFPYDWIAPTVGPDTDYGHELRDRIREIEDEFSQWLQPDELEFVHASESTGKDIYASRRLGHTFNHDFPLGASYDEMFPVVREKYHRRAERLLGLIRSARRVLVVRVDRPDLPVPTDVADCQDAVRALEGKFAPARFDFLQVSFEAGRKEVREEAFGGNVTRWTLDYHDHRPGAGSWQVDIPLLGGLLRERYSVRDYRTRAERKAFAAERRQKRYAKLGARNFLEYQILRLFRRK